MDKYFESRVKNLNIIPLKNYKELTKYLSDINLLL